MSAIGPDRERRVRALEGAGARGRVVDELLAYSESGFDPAGLATPVTHPLADEPFAATWQRFARNAETAGAASILTHNLVQLRFPIEAGMSEREEYREATRRGVLPDAVAFPAPPFRDPDGVSIALHATPAGRLPIIYTRARADFEFLVRALTRRNEPVPIPVSMGACIVGGYTNWTRVAEHRETWTRAQRASGAAADDAAWSRELGRIMPHRELYQDRFVIVSDGPYSGTPAEELGLADAEWRARSLVIRVEHECAHYYTRRVLGSMRNSLLDELVADYCGIVAAAGRFVPDWLLRFMGVEARTVARTGRLENYRGTPPLGDDAFAVLAELVRRSVCSLARFDVLVRARRASHDVQRSHDEVARAIRAIAGLGLEPLTEPGAERALLELYDANARHAPPTVHELAPSVTR